jgi:hypothetical protein
MTPQQYIDYLNTLPLSAALWHFIENMNDDSEGRSEVFFALRERVRDMAYPCAPTRTP